jgi:hypothetical protein
MTLMVLCPMPTHVPPLKCCAATAGHERASQHLLHSHAKIYDAVPGGPTTPSQHTCCKSNSQHCVVWISMQDHVSPPACCAASPSPVAGMHAGRNQCTPLVKCQQTRGASDARTCPSKHPPAVQPHLHMHAPLATLAADPPIAHTTL